MITPILFECVEVDKTLESDIGSPILRGFMPDHYISMRPFRAFDFAAFLKVS